MNFYTINRGLYKRLYKYFSDKSCQYENRREVKQFIHNLKCKPLTKSQKKEIKKYYASFGFKNICTDWHRLNTHLNGKFYKEYLPADFFYNVIEPNLNMREMFPALTDKNLLNIIFKGVKQPETVIKNINGLFTDNERNRVFEFHEVLEKCMQYSKLIIKPSIDSGGGRNIIVFKIKGNQTDYKNLTIEELINLYDKNFIIQNYLIQHEQISLLNPSSVNTLRFKTLLIKGKVEVLSGVIRIGCKDSKVDNTNAGGVYCRIDSQGKLFKNGYYGSKQVEYKTNSNVLLEGFQIPNYLRIKNDVKNLHSQIKHFKMVCWDIAIDQYGETVLIEYNVFGQGFGQEYGPFLGNYTDEILSMCKTEKLIC